jgi:hypothetical protein
MKLFNHTSLSNLTFERRGKQDEPLLTSVLCATYAVQGGALTPLEEVPLPIDPVHRGDPRSTSLRREGMLATFKPRCDVHLDAVARSPGGRPSRGWPVRVKVGSLVKDVMVRGPHDWRHGFAGWSLGEPAPCTEVPLTHEHAFGGSFLVDGEQLREPRNPLGTGYLPAGAPTALPVAAPQVVALDEPRHRAGDRYLPHGLNPIDNHVAPRLARAGTFDEAWKERRWPRLPVDFDFAFYNSAHPELVHATYLRGDERVDVVGLHPAGAVGFTLPSVFPWVRLSVGREVHPVPARLDTLHLDATAPDVSGWRVQLTWRVCVPVSTPPRRADIRLGDRADG